MKYIAFIVGIAAVTLYLLGYQQKKRKSIIVFNVTSRALYILQYLLLGAYEGAMLDMAGIISSVLARKKDRPFVKKHLKWFIVGVNLFIVAMGLVTYKNPYSLLPIGGVLLHTSAFWITDEKKIRWVSLLGCPFWLAYNLISGAYGSCIGDILSILSLLIAIFRYDIRPTAQKTRLLLIRHGESAANRREMFAGHMDADLLDKGLRQGKMTARYIAENYKVDKIYSSDLQRACKTAECIAKETGIEIIREPRLREIDGGRWEGKTYDEIRSQFPEDFGRWKRDIGKAVCTGGESVEQLGKRIMDTLVEIADGNRGKTVVVVTHATPIRATESLIRTGSLDAMQELPFVSNASLTEIVRKKAGFEIVKIGEDRQLMDCKTVLSSRV